MSIRMLVTECFDGNHAACRGYNGPADSPNFQCDCNCHGRDVMTNEKDILRVAKEIVLNWNAIRDENPEHAIENVAAILRSTIEAERSPASAAPVVDENRKILTAIRESMNACLEKSNDQSRPHEYRVMMGHFAEAGRQIIEMIEEGRYSGPISAHICEGCGIPTVVVQVSDDDVVLCPLCYSATPETAPDNRIQCPHCHWRPSPDLRPVNGLYKCANCDFKWVASGPAVESSPAATAVPQVLFEAKLLGFGEGDRIRLCEPCLRRAIDEHLVSFSCALPAVPVAKSNREPHAFQEHPLYPNYCAFAVGDEDYCKRETDNVIHQDATSGLFWVSKGC